MNSTQPIFNNQTNNPDDATTHHHHHHHHHHQNDNPGYNPALNTSLPQGQYDNNNNMNTGYDNTNVNPGYNTNINPATNTKPGYTNTNANPGYNTTTGTTACGYNNNTNNPGYNPSTLSGAPAGNYTGGPTDTSVNQPYSNAPTNTLNQQPYGGNNLSSTDPSTLNYNTQTGAPSASQGIKNTVAGTFQKIAGALANDPERKMAGEMRRQEGKQEVKAAQQHHGITTGYGNTDVGYGSTTTGTDYQGRNYDNTLNNAPLTGQNYGVGQNTAQGYNPAVPNQNNNTTTAGYGVGKHQQGYAQGNLGLQTREE